MPRPPPALNRDALVRRLLKAGFNIVDVTEFVTVTDMPRSLSAVYGMCTEVLKVLERLRGLTGSGDGPRLQRWQAIAEVIRTTEDIVRHPLTRA